MSTGSLITRIYSGFRGVDFRGAEIPAQRSPESLNMWRNYKKLSSIETRPGMELLEGFSAPVYGIYFYKDRMLVHTGTKLVEVTDGLQTVLWEDLQAGISEGFAYEGNWYFKDGKVYLQYDGSTMKTVEGYVPTTSIGRKPAGGGSTYEDVNMLSPYRINTFLADGISFDFYLDAQNIDTDFKPIVKVDDAEITGFTVDYAKGIVKIVKAPDAPLTDGQDNVWIKFRKTVDKYPKSILQCQLLQVFDNRVFFSGNPEHPSVVWHCSLNDPTYVSDLDYYREGMDNAKIRGLVAGNNALWVFREPSESNTNVFYHTPTIDDEYGKIYPSNHSSITTGCEGKAINFNDDIVFFSHRGMEGISGDITTEQVVAHRSSLVDRKLTAETGYRDMVLAEWEGYLLVIIGSAVYLADSRTAFTNEDHIEYDWYYWEMERPILCAKVQGGTLYLGTEDGVYTLTDTESPVTSYWVTPKDQFGYPHKLKTTNKRGCVAEAKGDIRVYAKVEDTDFEPVGEFAGIEDYFVSRIKRKKWKDIQLKFASDTRFSLESVSLEAWIGGYIKR